MSMPKNTSTRTSRNVLGWCWYWLTLLRGWGVAGAVAAVLAAGLVLRFLPAVFDLPQLANVQPLTAPTVTLACLVSGLSLAPIVQEPMTIVPWTSPRPLKTVAAGRLLVCVGVSVVVLCVLGRAPVDVVVIALSTVVAESVVLSQAIGKAGGWALPTAHFSAGLTFGAAGGHLAVWAWPLSSQPTLSHWLLTALTATAAAVSLFRRRRS